jgi:hypothetical protein
MSRVKEDNFNEDLYEQRSRFERRDMFHARIYSVAHGAQWVDGAILILRGLTATIGNVGRVYAIFESGLNDGLIVALGGFVVASSLSKRRSESYGLRVAALDGVIATQQNEQQSAITVESEQPHTDSL